MSGREGERRGFEGIERDVYGGKGRGRCLDEEDRVDAAIEFGVVRYLSVLGGERKVSSKERRGAERWSSYLSPHNLASGNATEFRDCKGRGNSAMGRGGKGGSRWWSSKDEHA
jgi:hypothetical protein